MFRLAFGVISLVAAIVLGFIARSHMPVQLNFPSSLGSIFLVFAVVAMVLLVIGGWRLKLIGLLLAVITIATM